MVSFRLPEKACVNIKQLWSYYDINQRLQSLQCQLEYSSMEIMKTKAHSPFYHLSDCPDIPCAIGYYRCFEYNYCVPIRYVCDGVFHCLNGDDEVDCGS